MIVWVGPAGARAASAGTYITLAANVAVMAPARDIGAATPIDSSGQDIGGDLGTRSCRTPRRCCARSPLRRNRNYDWALTTVTDAKAYTAEEALAAGGIDGSPTAAEAALPSPTGGQ